MRAAGIDIGSRTVKVAVCEDGRFTQQGLAYTTHDPLAVCRTLLEDCAWDVLTATGYGRHLFQQYWDCRVVTEIRAAAAGAKSGRSGTGMDCSIGYGGNCRFKRSCPSDLPMTVWTNFPVPCGRLESPS